MHPYPRAGTIAGVLGLVLVLPGSAAAGADLSAIRLPPGFEIHVFADDVPHARALALGEKGTVFVGTRSDDRVYALRDTDGDGRADRRYVIDENLTIPNGVAFRDGALYVAENGRVLRYDGIEERLSTPPDPVAVSTLPRYRHHGTRYIGFGPDGWMYVSLGAPCNVCEAPGFDTILRMRPDGSDADVFARGVRNSVGFDFHPETGDLWFTDNGRDWLGDNRPPDELNRAARAGEHFGFPYCHGGDIPDPELGSKRDCSEFTPPVQKLGPHVASLGMRFYTGEQFPLLYRGQVFVAEHGSWNRSTPIGYRVSLVRLEGDRAVSYEPFAEGWLQADGDVLGRPVDLLVMPDGSLLVSDDSSGSIYRIAYRGE
ncbi:MAG: sorbosone dehydrogenase family protein [Chromatiales bacterium]|jgi:glucose/arabinose dehydrogenase